MERNQYKLCREVLRRLEKAGILRHLISQRRQNSDKMMKDRDTAIKILRALIEKGETVEIKDVFQSAPRSWRQKIIRGLELAKESSIVQLLKD